MMGIGKELQVLFSLLSYVVGHLSQPLPESVSAEEWARVYRLACTQNIVGIAWDGLVVVVKQGALTENNAIPTNLKLQWYATVQSIEKEWTRQWETANTIGAAFASRNIRTVVLKGVAFGEYYRNPKSRYSCDLDCFLMGDYEKGNQIAEAELGATVKREHYKHSHIILNGLLVENHQFYTPIRSGRRTKQLERTLQQLLVEEGTHRIEDSCLEAPGHTFNGLLMLRHAQEHLLMEKLNLRFLTDWTVFISTALPAIDQTQFWKICDEAGMQDLADTLSALCVKHLGMAAIDGLPNDIRRQSMILENMIVAEGGLYSKPSKWQTRIGLFLDSVKNRDKYKYFSNESYLSNMARRIMAFAFNRNPQL